MDMAAVPLLTSSILLCSERESAILCADGRFTYRCAMQAHVISHDPDDRDHLAYLLRRAGYTVGSHAALEGLLSSWHERPGDILVLSRFELEHLEEDIHTVRGMTEAPLIILVDQASDGQISQLLELGADLVLPRPFGPKSLAAYTRRLLRRMGSIPAFTLPSIDLEDIRLNPSTRTVTCAQEEPIRLTQLEFRLLYTLMSNRGQVIPVENLIERVWGYEGTGSRELVRGLISRLRSKIEPDPREPRFIHTIPGVGYIFERNPE